MESQIAFWIAVAYGLGAHEEDLAPSDVVVALRTTWISQISGLVAIVTGKLSIIEFLDQIRGRHRGRPWFLYIVGISIVLVNLVVTVLPFFQCIPVDKLWDESVPGDCSLRELAQTYAYFQGSKFRLHLTAVARALGHMHPLLTFVSMQVTLPLRTSFWLSTLFTSYGASKCLDD